jgi:hypothetical protein
MKKSESGNIGSPVDEEKMELMKEYDSVKGGDTIRADWRLPPLKCFRDPRKTTNKKVKRKCSSTRRWMMSFIGELLTTYC